jgi:hypothetical protein
MKPTLADDRRTIERRIARRRLCALAALAAIALLLLSIAAVSGARSVATGLLRDAHSIFAGSRAALADNHRANRRRPTTVAGRYVAASPPASGVKPLPAGPADDMQPADSAPTTAAVAPADPSIPTTTPQPSMEPAMPVPLPLPKSEAQPLESDPAPPTKRGPEPPTVEPEPPTESEPEPPSAEPGEPPPTVPAEEPFFEGSKVEDFELIQAAPRAITEVADPLGSGETVLQMTVGEGDVAPITPTNNPRAQALSPDLIEPGGEFWLKTKFLLPQNFPTVSGWMSLVSIYGPPFNSSSPWQVEVIGDHLQWTRNRSYGYDVPWEAPLSKGSWVTLLLHERFATDGFVEMWINGQQVSFFSGNGFNPGDHPATTKLEMQTMDSSNNGGPNSAKIMQYREAGMFNTGTVFFGPLSLGDSRESVEG